MLCLPEPERSERLRDPATRAELAVEFEAEAATTIGMTWANLAVDQVADPANADKVGRTIAELAQAAGASTAAKDAAIEEARKALAAAELSGNSAQVLKTSSHLAALEGEKVTGLKPIVLGRGRGRGGGSWRGGRGRS